MKPGQRYIDIDERYRRYRSDSFRDKYRMLRPDAPCVTITAHMAKDGYRYIHWDREQCRTLSVREAARVQSFDDAFRFAGHRSNRYRMIGNAVPPLLSREIAVRVRRAIQGGLDLVEDREWQMALPLDATPLRDTASESLCAG
jgi:DNA (cytosine-5)-methyltransferase 1